jgi:hypothetical protein
MRRILLLAFGAVLVGAAFMLGAAGSAADGTPTASTSHPLVGSWDVEITRTGDTPTETVLVTFAADGTVIATDAEGLTWHGAWIATGPRSADYSYVTLGSERMPDGAIFFGQAEVEDSGDTFIRSSKFMSGGTEVHGERITAR